MVILGKIYILHVQTNRSRNKKKMQKITKPKLYYAHITRTHTHCYINSSTQYKGMYTSCSYHSLFVRQWMFTYFIAMEKWVERTKCWYHVFNIKWLSFQSRQSFYFRGEIRACLSCPFNITVIYYICNVKVEHKTNKL